jgi:prepilin peptidase CpaA
MLDQITILSTALLLALLIVAVASDMRSHRIPNWIVGGIFALGVLTQCTAKGWVGLTSAAPGALVALFFFLPFYVRQAMGAGDVKLMAATGAWLGPVGAALGCAMALIAGLVLAVLALVCRTLSVRGQALHATTHLIPSRLSAALVVERNGQLKVPYAAAVATGSVVCAWYLDKLAPITGLTN